MTWLRSIINKLDVPGGRTLLARYATWHARRTSGRDILVEYDGVWMHRINDIYWADSPNFAYHRLITPKWLRYADAQLDWGHDFWFHLYEPKQGDVIVDIGAGTGTDLPLFSQQVGPTGRVIAVEAHPLTFALMKKSVARNGLENVTGYQKAIVDKPCIVSISDDAQHISNAIQFGETSPSTTIDVEGCTLAEICEAATVQQIDLLKMNIEGAEQFAIEGMHEVLPRVRYVCICCHDFRSAKGDGGHFKTRARVIEFLSEHGFQITTRDDDPRDYVRDHIHGWNCRWTTES